MCPFVVFLFVFFWSKIDRSEVQIDSKDTGILTLIPVYNQAGFFKKF